jgi:hypothetical protein
VKTCLLPAIAIAMLVAQPTLAITPPPGPPEYSAYGPLQICATDFKIDIGAQEAVHIVGNITRLLNDDYLIAAVPAVLPDKTFENSATIPVILDDRRTAYRYTAQTPVANRELIFAPQALGADDIRYAVTVSGNESHFIIIGSTAFTGEASDKRILDRLSLVRANSPDCISPDIARALQFNSDASRYTKRARQRHAPQAGLYPPKPDTVRGFYCIGGIGFALKAGETLYRPWASLVEASEAMVRINGASIKISRREESLQRADENYVNEHPLGLLHQSRIIYYPCRGTGPPYAPENIHEDGSWSIRLGKGPRQQISVSFPASDKSPIGFQCLERLQFVEKDDPRCSTKEASIDVHNYLTTSPPRSPQALLWRSPDRR